MTAIADYTDHICGEAIGGATASPTATRRGWGDFAFELPAYALYPAGHGDACWGAFWSGAQQGTTASQLQSRPYEALMPYLVQLATVLSDETNFDEECSPPTPGAINRAFEYLIVTASSLYDYLPEGSLYPDGEGGIRVEWRYADRYVLLAVHPLDGRQDYIYHQQGSDKGNLVLVARSGSEELAGHLAWLQG